MRKAAAARMRDPRLRSLESYAGLDSAEAADRRLDACCQPTVAHYIAESLLRAQRWRDGRVA